MAFPLGEAIRDLFFRIAEALRGGGGGSIGPIPPRPPRPPVPPPPPPPRPPGPVYPEPPIVSGPRDPPTVVIVPPNNYFPVVPLGPKDPDQCEVLSLSDRIAIAALERSITDSDPYTYSPYLPVEPDEDTMPTSVGLGVPVESTDYFRFRAFSTSVSVEVSFFGRVQRTDGQIVPFGHKLQTVAANTVYETVVATGPGLLLGAAASVPVDSITSGAVSGIGEIGRVLNGAFLPHTLLFSGQLDDLTPLSTQTTTTTTAVGNPAFRFTSTFSSAGATSTATISITAGKRGRIVYVVGDYTCTAAAGNRHLTVSIGPVGDVYWRGLASRMAVASEKPVFRWSLGAQGSTPSGTLPGTFVEMAGTMPENLYWTGTLEVVLSAYGNLAGDTCTGTAIVWVEE